MVEPDFIQQLKEYLRYDDTDGHFYWLKSPSNRVRIGDRAGWRSKGYWQVQVLGCNFQAHRLVWLFVYGYLPEYIDHINGNGLDNRLSNLRECTVAQNQANSYHRSRGVSRRGNRFYAQIGVSGHLLWLGSYTTHEEAQAAYDAASIKHYGEFARCNRPL